MTYPKLDTFLRASLLNTLETIQREIVHLRQRFASHRNHEKKDKNFLKHTHTHKVSEVQNMHTPCYNVHALHRVSVCVFSFEFQGNIAILIHSILTPLHM